MTNEPSEVSGQKLYQAFAFYSDQALIALDATLAITALNPAAERLYRCRQADALTKSYDGFFTTIGLGLPVPLNLLVDGFDQQISYYESDVALSGLEIKKHFRWKIIRLNKTAGEIEQVMLMGQEIQGSAGSTLKQSDHANEKFSLESIIEVMPGTVYWKNRQGVYLGCNKNTVKILGFNDKSDIIGKRLEQLLPKDIADALLANDHDIMETGIPKIFEEIGPKADGELAVYLTHKVPLRDKDNNVIGLVGVSFDITQKKDLEKALQLAKQQADLQSRTVNLYLEHIVDNLPANIYWLDKNCAYLGCNTKVLNLLGLKSRAELIGRTYADFAKIGNWREDQGASFEKDDLDVLHTGIARLGIEEPPLPDLEGNLIYYLTSRVPLKDENGDVIGVAGISIDITERKVMEEALREAKERAESANQAKSEFLAAISHELRIPLTGILGMARLMIDEPMLETQVKKVNDIIMSGEHLLALVNDLLDLAKLEAGKLELHPAPLDLHQLIEEIAKMLTFQAKAKNLEVLANYAVDAPQMIIGDAKAIRQILLNLMGNAVKFTERGHVTISVKCIEQEQLKAHLMISVEDTGIGIPQDKLDSVFERFNQVDSSRTRRYGGAGLGLTITKAYVELMGGKIWVESEVGKGTRFHCEIPFPLQDMVHRPSVWQPYRSQVRVLIIDDTQRGDVIAKQLDCSYCHIEKGDLAFNAILTAQQKREPYHIIIMDQQLQSIDAMELGRRINQHRNLQKPMMVLLMPPSTVQMRESAKNSGFFETLIKPVQPTELLVALTAAWERWEDQSRAKNKTLSIFSDKQPVILLVEDDLIIQKVHTMMLEKLGCKVGVAQNSQEALAMYSKGYDAIFMDVGLPGMSGIEIAAEIRRREIGKGRIPIIGVTGYGYEEDKRNCLAAGMDDVAVKPLKPEELTQLLLKWVAKEQMKQTL